MVTTAATARLGPVPTALPSAQRSGVKQRAESARPRTASSVAAARSAGMPTKTGRRLVLHEGPGAHCHPVSNAASLTAWWKCNVPFAVARCAAFHSANHFSLSRSILRNTREKCTLRSRKSKSALLAKARARWWCRSCVRCLCSIRMPVHTRQHYALAESSSYFKMRIVCPVGRWRESCSATNFPPSPATRGRESLVSGFIIILGKV